MFSLRSKLKELEKRITRLECEHIIKYRHISCAKQSFVPYHDEYCEKCGKIFKQWSAYIPQHIKDMNKREIKINKLKVKYLKGRR